MTPPLPLSLRVLRVLAKKPASPPTLARETGALEGDVKRELSKHHAAGRVEVSGTSWVLTKSGLALSRGETGARQPLAKNEVAPKDAPDDPPRRKGRRGKLCVSGKPSPAALTVKLRLVERGLWTIVELVAQRHGEDPLGLVETTWTRNKVIARSEMFTRVLGFEGRRYSIPEVAQMFGRDDSVVRDGVQRWRRMQETGEAAA